MSFLLIWTVYFRKLFSITDQLVIEVSPMKGQNFGRWQEQLDDEFDNNYNDQQHDDDDDKMVKKRKDNPMM